MYFFFIQINFTGSILQQIALTASGQQGLNVPQLSQMQEEIEAQQTKSKKRSRKQYIQPSPRLSDSLPSIDGKSQKAGGRGRKQNFTILKPTMEAVVVEETVPNKTQPAKGPRRKRKSPVRSTMADILGEPEFVETFYLEESDNEDGESHGTSVSQRKTK